MSFIKSIKKSGNKINLYKLDQEMLSKQENGTTLFTSGLNICFLDLETTGLDVENNSPIEIAMKLVEFKKTTGELISAVAQYESYNDPGFPIDEHIVKLTGISDEMVKGHLIDWDKVASLLSISQIAVAHNAKFDRSFIDKYTNVEIVWACSQKDINWMERGFFKISLEMLCMWHGFYFGAHRAMNDVNATINLLIHSSYSNDRPMKELIGNAKKRTIRIIKRDVSSKL